MFPGLSVAFVCVSDAGNSHCCAHQGASSQLPAPAGRTSSHCATSGNSSGTQFTLCDVHHTPERTDFITREVKNVKCVLMVAPDESSCCYRDQRFYFLSLADVSGSDLHRQTDFKFLIWTLLVWFFESPLNDSNTSGVENIK